MRGQQGQPNSHVSVKNKVPRTSHGPSDDAHTTPTEDNPTHPEPHIQQTLLPPYETLTTHPEPHIQQTLLPRNETRTTHPEPHIQQTLLPRNECDNPVVTLVTEGLDV